MMNKINVILSLFVIGLVTIFSSCAHRPRNQRYGNKTTIAKTESHREKRSTVRVPTKRTSESVMEGPEIFQKYNAAVFMIFTSNGYEGFQGSGFFIDDHGLAVSNYHVFQNTLQGEEQIKLVGSNNAYKVTEVIAKDSEHDYIVFRVNCNQNKYLDIADKQPQVGEKVFAIGSPRGLENTFSSGEVSQWRSEDVMQINVQIDHGSSGGPLINQYGQVVGITSGTFFDGSQANLNYAWSIDVIKGSIR